MKLKKIIGWALLVIGLIIISWALYSAYNIFTAKVSTPEIFKLEEKKPEVSKKITISPSQEELQKEMEKIVEEQIKEIIPSEFLAKLLNLISWSIFVGILVFGGGKISAIGIKIMGDKSN